MTNQDQTQQRREALGPAETILNTLLSHTDHSFHGRPGAIFPDGRTKVGARWEPVTYKEVDGQKVVYKVIKVGKKTIKSQIGFLGEDGTSIYTDHGAKIATYRASGLFPEVVAWLYGEIAKVYERDNEFVARWASYAFKQTHRDLKVILAAFLLVQSRKGDPVLDAGEVLFYDEDFRDVGEAMMLLQEKGLDLNPKLLLRIWQILTLPEIVTINRKLGFAHSDRKPFLGRWPRVVEKWLRFREENPSVLQGLVKTGFRTTVMRLAQIIGYKPTTDRFFEILRWKQKQAKDGRRELAIGKVLKDAESWETLTERQICQRIVKSKYNWKRIVGMLPTSVGVTRAIVAAAIEAGSLSDRDLIIMTPTLEELGLLKVKEVQERWEAAMKSAEDQRAANIARNVSSKEVKEKLEATADRAAQKVVEEATKDLRVYFFVDVSSSMHGALEAAKPMISKFLQAIPLEKMHVATFNTVGKVIPIKHRSEKGVEAAFRGIRASGGTSHGAGIRAVQSYKPQPGEDVLFVFIGDEQESWNFSSAVQDSGLNPMAFGLLKVSTHMEYGTAVRGTADDLGLPCFMLDQKTFEDPYAIPRTIRALISATPVGHSSGNITRPRRTSLVEQILGTDLLQKPAWA